jgi:hypothetical protein
LARSCDRRAVVAADDALGNLEFAVMRNSIVGGYLGAFPRRQVLITGE